MSKALKVIGVVAGAVAIVATAGALLVPALGIAAGAAATLGTIATVASVVAGVANIGVSLLAGPAGGRPPPARGTLARILIDPNAPRPCHIGRCYSGGVLRHDCAYGATLNEVPNPYRGMVVVYSGVGPNKSITPKLDYASIGAYYSGYVNTATQLGACPESGALTPHWAGMPNWGSGYKLSGHAAILWNLLFDKAGQVFAGGLPLQGAVVEGCKCYDPRKDSTFPGGSGSHRVYDETTWEYSRNPALHAATYAYGRRQNGKLVFGIGMPSSAIVWSDVAAWANTCTANDWNTDGVIYEGGDDVQKQRWGNLTEICLAGGAQPVFANGLLGFFWSAPKTTLDTITDADILGDDASVTAMQPWRERINTAVPQYRSETHNWEMVSAESVSVSTYVTEDGEEKIETWPFNLVTAGDQAAELATYRIVNGRELSPIMIKVKPRLRGYRPGDCLQLSSDLLDIDMPCVILHRELDPGTMQVMLTLVSETSAKHAYALGLTSVPPPTPVLQMSGQDRDDVAANARGIEKTNLIYVKYATNPGTPSPTPGVPPGWFDDAATASAAAGDLPLWECFGIKLKGAVNFVWNSPVEAVIDGRIHDAIDSGGTVKDGQVGTGAIVGGAIASPSVAFGSDVFVSGASSADGSIYTLYTTGWITIGDLVDGQAFVQGFCWMDGQNSDCGAKMYLDVDVGAGFVNAAVNQCGARTTGGDTFMRGNLHAATTVAGVSQIRVQLRIQSVRMGGATNSFNFYARDPAVVVFGSKR